MKWSWTIGWIAGIQVRMHWTFLLLLAWVGYSFGMVDGSWQWQAGLQGIVFVLAIFGCVILHEAGHALTARRYGVETEDITLLPIGGVARLQRIPSDPWAEFWIAIAGPAVNVVIAAVLFMIVFAVHGLAILGRIDLTPKTPFLINLMLVNGLLVAFNLLPAFPMDGGRILRALLATRMEYVQATDIAASVGQMMAIVFGITGLFGPNPFLLLIAFFVYLGAEAEAQYVRTQSLLGDSRVRDAMMTHFHVLSPRDTLQTAVDELLRGAQQDFPVLDGGRFQGLLRRRDLVAALREHSAEQTIDGAYETIDERIREEMPVQEAIELMRKLDCKSLPVFRGEEIVGMLSLENVSELMMIRSASRGHAAAARPSSSAHAARGG